MSNSCDPMNCSTPDFLDLHCFPEFAQTQIHWVRMPSNHLILCHPPFPLALNFSHHQGLSNELAFRIRWPKYWSFSFSISSSNEYSRLISFRIDWFDLLAVQGTLKGFLQHDGLKACCNSWGHKESDTTKWLNWTELTEVTNTIIQKQYIQHVCPRRNIEVSMYIVCNPENLAII